MIEAILLVMDNDIIYVSEPLLIGVFHSTGNLCSYTNITMANP